MQLTKSNYFSLEASRHYMSVSQFKGFLPSYEGCEARAMAELAGEYVRKEKEVFLEGKYIHAWNEGVLAEFKAENPDIFSSKGPTVGQLKANFKHCNAMIDVLENSPFIMKALSGEKEVILTAELFGIPWKIMIDDRNLQAGIFTDLKAMREIEGRFWNKEAGGYENFVYHYGYNIQAAVYAEVEKKANKRENWLIPLICVVTKQDPPDHEIMYFDFDAIDQGLAIVSRHIERVKAVKSGKEKPIRCDRCDYCRATKKVTQFKHYKEFSLN